MRIAFLGDLAANDAILTRLERGEESHIAHAVKSVTDDCELVIANLEGCWDKDGLAAPAGGPDKIHVRTGPHVVGLLKQLNVSIVSAANNHSFDFGFDGYAPLREEMEAQGIRSVGGGSNLAEAAEPLVLQQGETRIGVLAYADPDCGAVLAGTDTPGANPFDPNRAAAEIRDLKKSCEVVVVSIHWGEERICLPSPKLRTWAAVLAKAGADIVAGHHPHVLQGYEKIHDSHIFYSLGNFLMADVLDNGRCLVRFCRPNFWSAIPVLESEEGTRMRLQEVVGIHSTKLGVITLVEEQRFQRLWRKLCDSLTVVDYEKRFRRHQDFMWRYYIPIRYQLLQNPLGTLRSLQFGKLVRLLGIGRSPWQEKSTERGVR